MAYLKDLGGPEGEHKISISAEGSRSPITALLLIGTGGEIIYPCLCRSAETGFIFSHTCLIFLSDGSLISWTWLLEDDLENI